MPATEAPTWIQALLRADAFPHPVTKLRLLETHISWVILTGPFAYKIKKPLKLEFLDFSTLELRRRYCNEELRLNRRWAPSLYLEVVTITGTPEAPSVGGSGKVIDVALKMREFPQEARLDNQLALGELDSEDMRELAENVAAFQLDSEALDFVDEAQAIEHVQQPMQDNFTILEGHADEERLRRIREWTFANLERLRPDLVARHRDGYVRDCHGDLHLANLVRTDAGIVPFDCIEFDVDLRTIDVLSDAAFLVMDLAARGRQDLSYAFLNRYLECTGDYEGMSVFRLYFVYHAMIRAKVAAIRSDERSVRTDRLHDIGEANHYCDVALEWIDCRAPRLFVMHGFSGSGKTWLSERLMQNLPAIRVRSDVERKREHGLAEAARSGSAVGEGIYSGESTDALYALLCAHAGRLLSAGFDVILDASFLDRSKRRACRDLASRAGSGLVLISVEADRGTLLERLHARGQELTEASEADTAVLQHQLKHADPLTAAEQAIAIVVDSREPVDADALVARIEAHCRRRKE